MNEIELKELICRLDLGVSKDGAEICFKSYGEVSMRANPQGYLRLGIEFLKLAYSENDGQGCLDYLLSNDSEPCVIDHFVHTKEELDFWSS